MILTSILLGTVILLAMLSGCEETLEVCPPCGKILYGEEVTNTAEPRLDGTLEAVQRIRLTTLQISDRFNSAAARLANVLAVDMPDDNLDDGTITALANAIADALSLSEENAVGIAVRFPDCFVDWKTAMRVQSRCEESLCKANASPGTGLCVGYFEGRCIYSKKTDIDGCYKVQKESAESCENSCIGVCVEMTDSVCPGECVGECDDVCDNYDTDMTTCLGTCAGRCTGRCESETPFACNGTCVGLCAVIADQGECTEEDVFFGSCSVETAVGECSGHLYPKGCDAQCQQCDAADDCRETAKYLAWAGLRCSGGAVRFYNLPVENTFEDAARLIALSAIEQVLEQMLSDYAWLSLMVEGYNIKQGDLSGRFKKNIQSTHLDDLMFDYAPIEGEISPADPSRSALPLESLKARLFWLKQKALNSKSGYRITAGAFDCLGSTLDDALLLLDEMIPTQEESQEDGTTFKADFECENRKSDDSNDQIPPCLYQLLKRQEALLAPLLPEKS